MKLIVAGSGGYVATEIIRQALMHPSITSIITLGRREAPVPPNSDPTVAATKLKSVICNDFEKYSDDVKKELSGADACIWYDTHPCNHNLGIVSILTRNYQSRTIGLTPSKSSSHPWAQVVKICCDYTLTGLETISQLPRSDPNGTPFRFIYISAMGIERNPPSKPWIMGDFKVMKGETESRILEYAEQSHGSVEVYIAKPGLIGGEGMVRGVLMGAIKTVGRAVSSRMLVVDVEEVAAALLDGAVGGFGGKEDFFNEDLVRIGRGVLDRGGKGAREGVKGARTE